MTTSKLTSDMKLQVINYMCHYSKGMLEDIDELGVAYDEDRDTIAEELHEFIENCRETLENSLEDE